MKKKTPAVLDPDVDDFCYLVARVVIRLLECSASDVGKSGDKSDRDQTTGSPMKPSTE